MSGIKYYDGSTFKDSEIKYYDGGKWVECSPSYFSTKWESSTTSSATTYTKTWNASWSQAYDEDNSKRDTDYLYQGWNGTSYHGSQRSLIGFDTGAIKKELEGATITSCTVKFYSKQTWWNSGGIYRVGYHNHSSIPSSFSHTVGYKHDVEGGKPSWCSFTSKALAEGIRDGVYKGISLFCGTSKDQTYYGYVTTHSSSTPPTITVTYTK